MATKEIKRNAEGVAINDLGITFNQWAENLKIQYRLNLRKLKKIKDA